MASLLGQIGIVVTSSSPSTPPASNPETPATPATPNSPVATGMALRQWNLQQGETLFFNTRTCSYAIPVPWSAWRVTYVWPDGDAVLVRDKQVMTTMGLTVGYNLRRAAETYADTFPGPQ